MSIVSAAELHQLIEASERRPDADPGSASALVVADVRFYLSDHDQGRREYDTAHIPGAVFVDLHTDLADTSIDNGGRHPLPSTATFGATLGHLGITPDTIVVAYDNHGGAMAARLWWMLRSVGHRDVRVLDGGIAAWNSAGYELSDQVPVAQSTTYPVPDHWSGTIGADEVGELGQRRRTPHHENDQGDAGSAQSDVVVVDSRAPERYRGDVEPLDPRAGHIPGAINRFHGDVIGPDGRFRSAAELTEHFSGLGQTPVVYCGSGVTACHNLLAMDRAGITDALLYPGSWSAWSSDPSRPIATGDED